MFNSHQKHPCGGWTGALGSVRSGELDELLPDDADDGVVVLLVVDACPVPDVDVVVQTVSLRRHQGAPCGEGGPGTTLVNRCR